MPRFAQGAGLAGRVAGLPEQVQGLLEVVGAVPVAAQLGVGGAEVGQGVGLTGRVAGLLGGVQGAALHGKGIGLVPPAI